MSLTVHYFLFSGIQRSRRISLFQRSWAPGWLSNVRLFLRYVVIRMHVGQHDFPQRAILSRPRQLRSGKMLILKGCLLSYSAAVVVIWDFMVKLYLDFHVAFNSSCFLKWKFRSFVALYRRSSYFSMLAFHPFYTLWKNEPMLKISPKVFIYFKVISNFLKEP